MNSAQVFVVAIMGTMQLAAPEHQLRDEEVEKLSLHTHEDPRNSLPEGHFTLGQDFLM